MKWPLSPLLALALILGCQENAANPSDRPPPDTSLIRVRADSTSS